MTDIYYATVGDAECESFDSDYYYFEELESYIEDEYRELVSEYEYLFNREEYDHEG